MGIIRSQNCFLLSVFILSLVSCGTSRILAQELELTRTGARQTLVVKAVQRTKGAVVNIVTESYERPSNPLLTSQLVNKGATGFVIDARGLIVTNHHVVDETHSLRCRLSDGTSYEAKIVATDPAQDLAIIRIRPRKALPCILPGTSSDLMVGETVIAIGNPHGLENSVSVGVISAVSRDLEVAKGSWRRSLIQTDAAINGGNSGGPLINVHGEFIGVIFSKHTSPGIGFAVPADQMIRSVHDMLQSRRSTYDGAVVRDRFVEGTEGIERSVEVEKVHRNSPAEEAGLRSGDVILKLDDQPIVCSYDFHRALLESSAGASVPLVLRRDEVELRLVLVLSGQGTAQSAKQGQSSARRKPTEKPKGKNYNPPE